MKNYLVVLLILPLIVKCTGQNTTINCPSVELPCDNGGQCILRNMWCDEKNDCEDGSDEKYCKLAGWFKSDPNKCRETHFRCDDGKCFPHSAVCDGPKDCKEGEDEFDCNTTDETTQNGITLESSDAKVDTKTTVGFIELEETTTASITHQNTDTDFATEDISGSTSFASLGTAVEPLTDEYHYATNAPDYYPGEIESDFESNGPVEKAVRWILSERLHNYGWGKNTPRAIVALALAEPVRFSNGRPEESLMKKRLLLEITEFVIRNETRHPQYAPRLASYINAMLATCQDPNHFENIDLVKTLRQHVNMGSSPSVYLTLCIANSTDFNDMRVILDMLNSKRAKIWPEFEALSLLALHCMADKLKLGDQYTSLEHHFAELLKGKFTTPHGKLRNVPSPALAKQVLDAVYGTEQWQSLITYLVKDHQKADGSFGDFRSTCYALSALVGRSRLFLGSMPCPLKPKVNEYPLLELPKNSKGPAKDVRYSVFFGFPTFDSAHFINAHVPTSATFFDIMRLAATKDTKFRFLYNSYGESVNVYSIGDLANDVEKGLTWQHGLMLNRYAKRFQSFDPSHTSVKILVPRDGDHIAIWYRETGR